MSYPQVALSKDFMEAYSRLPRKIQKKVREFTEKFQQDPTQPGLNFERLEKARDPKVRSVRIDQAYRAIVIHPPKGDVYLCVWVDHHDEAYQWARNRCFEVNPLSGSFQVYEMGKTQVPAEPEGAPTVAEAAGGLFEKFDDEDLLLGGVPMPLMPAVRALSTETDLDSLAPHLPQDAADVLYLMAAGFSLLEAIEEAGRSEKGPESVDVQDFKAALSKPASQEQFKVVSDEEELEAMLDAPLEQWRVFLHPSQRAMVEMNANGPVRVLGGAGTGKTVVLMHRANHLASNVYTEEADRILVTTFTRNLALDLRMNLKNLCTKEVFSRLEVVNLHSWAASFMRRQGHRFRISRDEERKALFELAATEARDPSLPLDFYMDEWDQVVQAQEVQSREDYLTARRVGRGIRLSKRQRSEVWEVLSRFRELLNEKNWTEWDDVIRETRLFIEKQRVPLPYCAILSDEAQDFSASELRLLRTLAPESSNTLYLVGDGHQRIYGQPVKMSACGIAIRGRSRRLKLNYRTTQQIRERAISILEGRKIDDLDGGIDSLSGYHSLRSGPLPEVRHFTSEAEEGEYVVRKIRQWLEQGVDDKAICLAVRTRSQLSDRYRPMMVAAGVKTVTVEMDPEGEEQKEGVRLSTMHRMKGLEFSRVLLAGVQEGKVPLDLPSISDEVEQARREMLERCLFYVSSTRARDELAITGFGRMSMFLEGWKT